MSVVGTNAELGVTWVHSYVTEVHEDVLHLRRAQPKFGRAVMSVALTASACLFPLNGFADSLPSGERTLGKASIEHANDDANGSNWEGRHA